MEILASPCCYRVREHQQKTYVILRRFWPLWGQGWLSESVKKGKLVTKIFFSDNAEWMYLLNFYKKYIASKLEIQCKNGMFFS